MATITKITNPTNPWRVQIRRAGQSTISKCFPTNVEAKRWARAEETKLDKNPNANGGGNITFGELVNIYVEKFARRNDAGELRPDVNSRFRLLNKSLGHYRLKELNIDVFRQYAQEPRHNTHKDQIARNPKPIAGRTRKIKLDIVSRVLRHAGTFAKAQSICSVAVNELKTLVAELQMENQVSENSRDRRPTEAELMKLEAYFARPSNRAQLPMWDLILFAMSTCMRRGEITKIVWEDFDPIDRTIWIRDRKDPSGAHRRNDLVPLLKGTFDWRGAPVDPIAIMSNLAFRTGKPRTGRVFPYFAKHVTTRFTKACKDLNIPDLHFHDLRHEGVSRLFEDGRPMEQVSVVSGHRSWKDLKRYTNLKPKNLHRDTVTP